MSVTRLRVDLAYRDAGEAIGTAFLGGPVALRFDEQRDVENEYLESIAKFRDVDGYLVPGEFVIATAVRQ